MRNFLFLTASLLLTSPTFAKVHLERLSVPDNLQIELVTDQVPDARQMAISADGSQLFVGSRRGGKVHRVDLGNAAEVTVIASGLTLPSGIALRRSETGEDLYIGALNEIWVIKSATAGNTDATLLTDALPDKKHHGWKALAFGPDGNLYVPVGAPCNICLSDDPRFASILQMDPDTGEATVYAHGVRNSVGIAFHPETGAMWFTDNGRDMLGDDTPPEEVNIATEAGQHFGYPYLHGHDVLDPKFGDRLRTMRLPITRPTITMQAHAAALGLVFNTGDGLGDAWRDTLFIAQHGSWNRSSKVGYEVGVVMLSDDELNYRPFVTGWLQEGKSWGRPTDVLIAPDGSLYISDDQNNAIYRVSRLPGLE